MLFPLLLCAVRTGLRLGELIGAQWGAVDFNGRFLEVRRSVVRGLVTTPKNHRIRRVDLSPQLVQELKRLKEIRQLSAMASGKPMSEWVFLSPKGCRWDDANLKHTWKRCQEASGLRQIRFHDLRHTFASLLIDQGAHGKYVQEQLGHGSIQMTMDIYGHLFPNRNRGWVDMLDEPRGGNRAQTEPATQPQPERDLEKQLRVTG